MPYSLLEAKEISELCTVVDCEHKTAPYVGSSNYLVVRTSNVRNGQLLMEDMKFTTSEGYKEWTQRAVPEYGDVLFTREAPAGESCLVPYNTKVCMGQRMVMLRPMKEKTDPVFLSLILNTERTKADISRLSIGSTVSRINIADIKKLKVSSPPLPEQQKIAKILSTWDKAITTTEKLIANSKQQKKALMQQLLTGKKRLVNPETGKEFEGEWNRYSLSDLVDIDRKSLGKKTHEDFEFKYISLSDVAGGVISKDLENVVFSNAPSRARRILQDGDILLSTVRPNLKGFAKVTRSYSECIASTGFSVLTSKKQVSADYVYQYIFGAHITGQIDSLVVGSNYPAINSSDVGGLKVYCPTYNEQQKIASVLTAADKEIELLEEKLAHLKQEKKALMQQLLTGKRRVKIAA
ncbi:restriction endonuclease subunit S [Vibrio atlanticus]|uniref:Type-1 restriction enzyme EcoKI specificity protein n=1 Tax=Vibrio atlanticus TaxID=693153 RepID=A0A1C3IQ94_9VIBR|nr:restriction endonuclease subunit S [Vibrio atlanticus]SBS63560.1 Type-1 restriction enzyme EcoKI specificity protein [Vibrio atlanticus]